jgi:uncharacterized protein YdaU (DUF1376 family)
MAHWYPRYPGDYAKDTGDLSTLEHGIYTLLLDAYYSTGPLTADYYRLYRLAKVGHKLSDREAVKAIVDRFFPLTGDGLRHNKRADEEREKIKARADRAIGLAQKRWNK